MTGQFLDPLIVQAYAKGTIYTAPKYFITDLASTPWLVKRASRIGREWLFTTGFIVRTS